VGRSDAERGWWQRNWGWCLGCGCLLPVLALGGLAFGTWRVASGFFESNSALETAVQRVNDNPVAVNLLGSPIEPKLWRENTNINFKGKDKMEARFGLAGPEGEGRVRVEAHYDRGEDAWLVDLLRLTVDGHDETIDLLDENPSP